MRKIGLLIPKTNLTVEHERGPNLNLRQVPFALDYSSLKEWI